MDAAAKREKDEKAKKKGQEFAGSPPFRRLAASPFPPAPCSPSCLPYLAPLRSLQPGRAALLWGEAIRSLGAMACAWAVARGAEVLVVDAANVFDPYRLVREARKLDVPPREALVRVRVARAFTSHQLVRLVQEELAGGLAPGCLVLVLGPVSLFYDEQVPLAERRRLFQGLVQALAAVKARHPLLLLQPRLPQGAGNRHFGRLLRPVLDAIGHAEEGRKAVSPEPVAGPAPLQSPGYR